jgi:Ca2+/Na+ antiporter
MVLLSLLPLCAGLAIVVYGADEAMKRLLNLARFFRLSVFVTGVVIAGTVAVLPEMSIGVIARALDCFSIVFCNHRHVYDVYRSVLVHVRIGVPFLVSRARWLRFLFFYSCGHH